MAGRDTLQRLIDRKREEIAELEIQLREALVYVQALQDAMKALPRENGSLSEQKTLRPGTDLARAREAILAFGRPLHVSEILKAINKPNDKKNRLSLSGSLAGYVRSGQIFTRPEPNTFGLVELDSKDQDKTVGAEAVEVHSAFGKV